MTSFFSHFQDGFYDGRNLDGHYGLIPSNFVEFIANPQDLPEHVRISIEKLKKKTSSRREIVSNPIENEVFIPKSSRTVVHHSSSSDVSSDDRSQSKHSEFCLFFLFCSLSFSSSFFCFQFHHRRIFTSKNF